MSPPQPKSDVYKYARQSSALAPWNDWARARGVQQKDSLSLLRKSARLQERQRLSRRLESQEEVHQLPSPTSATCSNEPQQDPLAPVRPSNLERKRKRAQFEVVPRYDKENHWQKRPKTSPTNSAEGSANLQLLTNINPIRFWRENHNWPPEYFERDARMSQPLLRKRSSSIRSSEVQSSPGTPTDLPREAKSAPYKDARYETHLATRGALMTIPPVKVDDKCKALCQRLLDSEQPTPENSLFHDDRFEMICSMIQNENEARIIQDITRLIVPSAETLFVYGATNLDILIEKVNSSWLKCLPLTDVRPQPDYSVGFRASAFTKDQLKKLSPFVGGYKDQCSVMAREDMYFPFLTCEVKCGDQALNVADRQNMHSASVSVKGLLELFKRIERDDELHRKILAFSVSHDNEAVRIYGHYALINGTETHFYRYAIHKFDFTAQDGKDRWTAYTFIRNVYDIYVPMHLQRIRAAVDELPDPEVFLVEHLSQQSNADLVEQDDSQSTVSCSQDSTPLLPSSQTSEPEFKKPKVRGTKR